MKAKLRTSLVLIITIIITCFTLVGCGFKLSNNSVELQPPDVKFNSTEKYLYWTACGGDKYQVLINNEVKDVFYTFYDTSSLKEGEYTISVRAVDVNDDTNTSKYSKAITLTVNSLGAQTATTTSGEIQPTPSGENNYKQIINNVTENAVNSTFEVVNQTKKAMGSGVLYKVVGGYYYILTNNHVVAPDSIFGAEYFVYDAKGYSYQAELIYGNKNYDLAVVRFRATSATYKPLNLASANPSVYQTIIAIGTPDGQINAITIGEVLKYKEITPDKDAINVSNVTFPVIHHNAPIKHGSSGGVLIDTNLNVVGVNFAAGTDSDTGEYVVSYSIPIEKIKEFLNLIN